MILPGGFNHEKRQKMTCVSMCSNHRRWLTNYPTAGQANGKRIERE